MGTFYTNVALYKPQQQPVADYLAKQKRTAYVSPTLNDFTVVYDKATEAQDADVLQNLTELLTRQFKCTGLASLVHDSDVYLYWLYDGGKLLDSYSSMPAYFDEDAGDGDPGPQRGDPQKLCTAFGRPDALDALTDIFESVEQGGEELLFAEEIHAKLVEALGMPPFAAFTGYRMIDNHDLAVALDESTFVKV